MFVYSAMVVLWLLDITSRVGGAIGAQIVVRAYTGRYKIALKGQQIWFNIYFFH